MKSITMLTRLVILLSLMIAAFSVSKPVGADNQNRSSSDNFQKKSVNQTFYYFNYMPVITNHYCTPQAVDSPFSIQIEALHQITVTAGLANPVNSTVGTMNEEQLKAWYVQAFPTLLDAMKASGAGWTRVMIRWSDVEPNAPAQGQPPVFDWSWYDSRLSQIGQMGIKMIMSFGYIPVWASAGVACPPIADKYLDDYKKFLTEAVNRYSQPPYNVTTWEIFNESDNTISSFSPQYGCWGNFGPNYANILAISYTIIKSINPQATVLMSGIAYDDFTEYGGLFNRYFIDDVVSQPGVTNYFDAFNFHYFPSLYAEWGQWNPQHRPSCGNVYTGTGPWYDAFGIDIIAKKNHLMNRMGTCFGINNKQVWVTETAEHGYYPGENPSFPDGTLYIQAQYVPKVYARSLASGIKNITWYALTTPFFPFEQSLLNNIDFSPKPAYTAYQTMTAELKNFVYEKTMAVPGAEVYVFNTSCLDEKMVAWGNTWDNNAPLNLSPAKTLRVVDYMGNLTTIQDGGPGDLDGQVNDSITINLTTNPIYVSITMK